MMEPHESRIGKSFFSRVRGKKSLLGKKANSFVVLVHYVRCNAIYDESKGIEWPYQFSVLLIL